MKIESILEFLFKRHFWSNSFFEKDVRRIKNVFKGFRSENVLETFLKFIVHSKAESLRWNLLCPSAFRIKVTSDNRFNIFVHKYSVILHRWLLYLSSFASVFERNFQAIFSSIHFLHKETFFSGKLNIFAI